MKKAVILLMIAAVVVFASCTTNTNYTANLSGVSDYSTVVVKDFTTLGIVTVRSSEIHNSGPLGFVKSIEGSKITYSDFMQEAAKLEADDIINVRIDINSSYVKKAFDWLTGWTKTYSYTGTALAIKYTGKLDTKTANPQLGGLPKEPALSGAVKRTRDGQVQLK